ncbi:MAG: hypothetical protein GC159_17270 [Phycisphaera sp.]|nr:hypothetical protein [Phycisphaera sp.]
MHLHHVPPHLLLHLTVGPGPRTVDARERALVLVFTIAITVTVVVIVVAIASPLPIGVLLEHVLRRAFAVVVIVIIVVAVAVLAAIVVVAILVPRLLLATLTRFAETLLERAGLVFAALTQQLLALLGELVQFLLGRLDTIAIAVPPVPVVGVRHDAQPRQRQGDRHDEQNTCPHDVYL